MKKRLIYVLTILLLIILAAWLFVSRYDMMSNHIIFSNEQSRVRFLSPIYDVNVQRDIVYASKKNETESKEDLKLDLYEPANDTNKQRPVVIFIHGGGFYMGTKSDAATISADLAKRGYVVLSIDYRLKVNPSFNYPKTLADDYEDIYDVMGWVKNNATTYGLDAEHIALGGDSAGGILSINFVNEYLIREPSYIKPIFAIIDIYGGSLRLGLQDHYPPVLIVHGTQDQSIPYQQSLNFNNALEEKGIYHNLLTMENVGHDYKNEKYFDMIVENSSHFLWNVLSRPQNEWLPESTGIMAVTGEQFDIKLPQGYIKNLDEGILNITLPEGWSLVNTKDNPSLRVQIPISLDRGIYSIIVAQEHGKEPDRSFALSVKVIDPLNVSFETYFDNTDQKIKTHVQVTNQSNRRFNGSLQFTYDTDQASQGSFTSIVDELDPGMSQTIDIPDLVQGKRTVRGLNNSDTLLQMTEDSFHALRIHKLSNPIQIDGNLEEWKEQVSFDVNDVKMDNWKGVQDTSGVGHLTWDNNNLYLAVEVTDDKHSQEENGDAIWNGDSVQFAIGVANEDGSVPGDYHEMGVALTDKRDLSKWRWMAPAGFGMGEYVEIDQAIIRNNNKTIYEMAIPWSELTEDTKAMKQGVKLKFSMLINDNDGNGRKGWLEFNSGIGTAKNIHAFGDLYLVD
ncbi:alpha/beta hydrolase fold domain-containing protein [Paenibacillus segetis]|uniref:Alpha/beta hydrolase fold domain-containing protein n=1 Tax=Paenibacillus segetis TaxID=1325360 RepID=A0ABQ1YBW2_9BACL|nr:alpha/beta hydrolase fold domain-containing protein [Paenibacillus segetis]GGH19105.1 hypothetical protein GCM10008013_15550 [Paenibacillus segetis]